MIAFRDVHKGFGAKRVLEGFSLEVPDGETTVIVGYSGSGKSVALKALEDAGFFCVDNLPAELIGPLADYAMSRGEPKVAISADARSRDSLGRLPDIVGKEKARGNDVRVIFLDANDESLVRRFSETRRPHPLAGEGRGRPEAIAEERRLLARIRRIGERHVVRARRQSGHEAQGVARAHADAARPRVSRPRTSRGG